MSDRRAGEEDQVPRFRTERFIHNGEKWYYETREGTTEGPFRTKLDAEEHLRNYVRLTNSGWMNNDADGLELEPSLQEPEPTSKPEPQAQNWAVRRGR